MRSLPLCCLAVFAAVGCGSRGGGDDTSGDFESIEIEPASATLTLPLGGTVSQGYTVFGITASGDRRDITTTCALSIDASFGSVTDATVTVGRGGKTDVNANCDSLTTSGVLVINLNGAVIGPGAPANAAELFDNATVATDPARTPGIEYPLDKAISPLNIPPVEVQYTVGGNDLFKVTMSSQFANVSVYTTAPEAMLTVAEWTAVATTAAGENLAFVVEGLAQAAPTSKFSSAPVLVTMSTDTIDQTAIYWWASSQGSIMSQTFGSLGAPELVKDQCTSCHSVSRNGNRIGYSRCVGGSCAGEDTAVGFMRFNSISQTWEEAVNADSKQILGSYTTFAPIGNPFPTDDQGLALVGKMGGTFGLYDPDTGAAVPSNVSVANNGGVSAMMPDWSADGTRVVYAQAQPGQYIDLTGGKIATMSYQYAAAAHVFGDPQIIAGDPVTLPNGTYDNYFFPSFSADGELVVYNAARGNWRRFDSARASGSRLMLTTATGAWTVDLTNLNGGYVDAGITWPHWAPTVSNEYYWVVFSSERDYGHRTTAATSPPSCIMNGVQQCKQIWLGAIAKNRLGPGMDPSSPPMWVPGQNPLANNISPYWSRPAVIQ